MLRINSIPVISPSTDESLWLYNGLDCMVTMEVRDALLPQLEARPFAKQTYDFELRSQAPALAFQLRGLLVDKSRRLKEIHAQRKLQARCEHIYDRLCDAATGRTWNHRSPKQLKELFYQRLGFPEIKSNMKGEWKVSTNRESLEKLHNKLIDLEPNLAALIVKALLKMRDLDKLIQVLEVELDADSRLRASYNVAGTETGRWSSSSNVFGRGTNLQNITKGLRHVFIADPGRKYCNADQEQAESRVVAYISGDRNYIEACESGDLHTYCCRLFWPNLPWNGDLSVDREIAERPYYRHFSYRDMSKRGGHASNYYATAWTVGRHLKLPIKVAEEFQEIYFGTFPGIRDYHKEVARRLASGAPLVTPFGRERHFFGRANDDATLRKAIAYVPQSTVGHITAQILLNLLEVEDELLIKILAQVHDSVLFDFPEGTDDETLQKVKPYFSVPVPFEGGTFTIPIEYKVGFDWENMQKWKGDGSTLSQERPNPIETAELLDTLIL